MTQNGQTPELAGRWWALAALALTTLTIGLDATVLNVALPTLSTELDASTSQLQWFGASYTLVLGALIIPVGSLGDRFGRKRLLMGGLTLFGLASVACAVSTSPGMLIAARAVQGIGGAAIMPLSMAMLPVLFTDGAERSRALNIWATSGALGLPLGPILGGWLLDHFAWGSVFLINVPLVLAGLVALAIHLPETKATRDRPIDLTGIALSSTGLVAVIYGLIEAGQGGWTSVSTLGPLAAGLLLLAAFLAWQRRATDPLVDLSLFADRDFSVGTALSTIANFALFGLLFVMPQFFQDVGGSKPLGTGVRLLPLIGGMVVATRVGPLVVKRVGAQAVLAGGFAICAAALGLAATTDVDTGYGFAAVWITLLGAGIGLVLPASMGAAVGALSAERAGSGAGLIQALRQVGGTIGVAVLGTVLNAGYHGQLDGAGVPASVAGEVRSGVGPGVEVADRLHNSALGEAVRSAFVHGMDLLLLTTAGLTLLGAVIAVLFLPRRAAAPPAPTPDAEALPLEPALAG